MVSNIKEKDIELAEKDLGILVRKYRKERGLTQRKLAEEAHVDSAYIGRLEVGKSIGSPSTLIVIARTLGIRPGVLLDALAGVQQISQVETVPEAAEMIRQYVALEDDQRDFVRKLIALFYQGNVSKEMAEELAGSEGYVKGRNEAANLQTQETAENDRNTAVDMLDAAVEAEEEERHKKNNNKKRKAGGENPR